MPFTPLHFGVNGAVAGATLGRVDIASCILANVAVDVQPFMVLYLR